MKKTYLFAIIMLALFSSNLAQNNEKGTTNPKIYIAFLWHMHQPIYWPYESVITTENNHVYSFSLYDVFLGRTGPYTNWPKDAVHKGINAGLGNFGAQVSFSGSLVENLNNLESSGIGFNGWKSSWNYIKNQKTVLNNPRIDMVGFGYHHPLMGLIDYQDIRKQIKAHKDIFATHLPGDYSKGMFPPENAFSERMIPALVDEGIEWVLVDNFNFERASVGCPVGDQTGVLRPNKSDIINPDPQDWKQLTGLWAPSPISARWAHQPHWVQHVDPSNGTIKKIIAVPASRYLGNEDGRGGFGALNYEDVMSQLESYNTDPNHPILIVLHHDGDNFGGGSEGYYGGNFQNFVNWLVANPSRFVCSTIQDYLQMFPPADSDIIKVQDGSWVGADSGDPEFKKWNGDPGNYMGTPNYSPDRNSWGVITAAKNIVLSAEQINASSNYTKDAWKYFLNAETSCYWYWDGTEMWDSHPTRACNLAVNQALNVYNINNDLTPPTIYIPQREPYNPGDVEWSNIVMPKNFTVWTYVYDHAGLQSVKLKWRTDNDGQNPLNSVQNETYIGGNEVGEWQEIAMNGTTINSITNPAATYKAQEYRAEISGQENVLIDYYVEAVDTKGNVAKSPIQHVWVGNGNGSGPGSITWEPANPTLHDVITITVPNASIGGKLHWGVNANGSNWTSPIQAYWPANSNLFNGTGPAVESQLIGPVNSNLTIQIGPFNDLQQVVNTVNFVIHFSDNSWNNNNGQDFNIPINNTSGPNPIGANKSINTLVNQNYQFSTDDFYFIGTGGATFNGIKIMSLETSGDLKYNNVDVTLNQDCPNVNQLVFIPESNATGSPYAQFTFKVKDSENRYSDATYLMTINVLSPNPIGANSSITVITGSTYQFNAGNFSFFSPLGHSFAAISFTQLPSEGNLTYNGNAININTDYTDLSLLHFSTTNGVYGTPYTSFSYKLKDNDGNYSLTSYVLTINVLAEFPEGISWLPQNPTTNDVITVVVNNNSTMNTYGGKLHWGVNKSGNAWTVPNEVYWPSGTSNYGDNQSVETPFSKIGNILYTLNIGPFNNTAQTVTSLHFVIHYNNNTWNNNNNQDWNIPITLALGAKQTKSTETSLKIYPNPFSNYTIIEILQPEIEEFIVTLKDLSGRTIIDTKMSSSEKIELHKNNLKSGVYILSAFSVFGNKRMNQRIIIY